MRLKFIVAFILILCVNISLRAQTYTYTLTGSPVDITGWNMTGDATISGEAIHLTPSIGDKWGQIHYGTPQLIDASCSKFTVTFQYRMFNGSSLPADGLAFWFLQDPPVGAVAGAGMGMPGTMRGFAFLIDVYNNDAINDNPIIGLRDFDFTGYVEGSTIGRVGTDLTSQTQTIDGTWRSVRIEYVSGNMEVYLDGALTPNISGAVDLDGLTGYFGFSAATGGQYLTHAIRNVSIAGASVPAEPVTDDTVILCQYDHEVALTVETTEPGGIIHWYDVAAGGTELPAAPVLSTATPGTSIWYVSQSRTDCDIESARVPIVVIVRPKPTVSVSPDGITICQGGSATLIATTNIDPSDPTINAGWSPVASLSSPTSLTTVATPTVSETYAYTVNTGAPGCVASDSVRVSVIPNDVVLLNDDMAVCYGENVLLNSTGRPEYTYRWTPETDIIDPMVQNTGMVARSSGYIYLTASHPGCADIVDSFYLEVQPVPKVELGPDRIICSGDTVKLFASTTPTYDAYTYDWNPGMKLTDSTIKDPVFIGYSSQEYILEVTTPIGCIGVDTINIIVNRTGFSTVNVTDTGICPNGSVQLLANGAESYQWYPSHGLNEDTIANPIASPNASTNYVLLATSPDGCVDSHNVYVEIYPEAVTTLPDSISIWPGEQYEIDMVSNAHYFQWFPPEGLDYTYVANPKANPDVRTRYYVEARTENGCTTRDSIDVIVNLESIFDIPNAFVPGNMNANNGVFKLIPRGTVKLNNFSIYNRWGNKVFETNDVNTGWNGTLNGEAQPMGVYIYTIEAELSSGRRITQTGNVTLIR